MAGAVAKPPKCLAGAERVQQLGSVTTVFLFALVARDTGQTVEERFERITRCVDDRRGCTRRRVSRPRLVILLLDHLGENKSIPVTRHRADESRLARIFAERPAERADRLA